MGKRVKKVPTNMGNQFS